MKFLLKIAVLVVTARVLAGTPRGSSREIDAVGDVTLRDVAREISSLVTKAETVVTDAWSKPVQPKAVSRRGTNVRRPAD
jgi:hypothetical protein